VFWYTVEFGVVREGGEHKASGAAILSSFGELENFAKVGASDRIERVRTGKVSVACGVPQSADTAGTARRAWHCCRCCTRAVCLCAQGGAELVPLDINSKLPKMIHKGGYQPRYLVMDSFEVRVVLSSAGGAAAVHAPAVRVHLLEP
jgi:hypothetical protein